MAGLIVSAIEKHLRLDKIEAMGTSHVENYGENSESS